MNENINSNSGDGEYHGRYEKTEPVSESRRKAAMVRAALEKQQREAENTETVKNEVPVTESSEYEQPLPQYEVVSHVAPVSHEIPKKTPDTNIGREFPVKGAVPVTEVKKKKFSVKDMLVKTLAIVTSFLLIVLLILNMPILVYSKSGGETENVSIITFLKRWQPLNIEGDLEENTMDLKIDEEVVDDDFTDGLDLPQTVEGQYSVLFLGFDEAADNTDVIWVFQFDIAGGKINVLQIPRDTFVPYYTSSYTGKFNSIYNSGDSSVSNIQRVVNAVQDNFAIPIDAYVTTHCYDIVDMVDLVGGIPISLEEGILYEADKIIPKGDSVLSGEQAEWFVRYRYGFSEGDIGRVKNQRKFLAAAMEKMLSIYSDEGKLTFYSYLKEIYENEYIHTDLSLEDISMIADFASNISLDNVQVNMVPGEGAWYYPDGHDRQSVWSVHKEETIAMLNEYFRPYQSDLTINESALVELTETHLSTANDDTSDTLQEIEDGEGTEAT